MIFLNLITTTFSQWESEVKTTWDNLPALPEGVISQWARLLQAQGEIVDIKQYIPVPYFLMASLVKEALEQRKQRLSEDKL